MASRRTFVDCGAPFEQGSLKPSIAARADPYVGSDVAVPDDPDLWDDTAVGYAESQDDEPEPYVPSFGAPPYPSGATVSGPFGFGAPGEQAEPQDDFDVEGYSLGELITTLQTVQQEFLFGPFSFPGADRLGQTLQDIKNGDKGANQLELELRNFIFAAESHMARSFEMGSNEKRGIKRAQAIAREAISVLREIEYSPGR